jgi:hypothetical protein
VINAKIDMPLLPQSASRSSASVKKKETRGRKKNAKGMVTHPLSAYKFFPFQENKNVAKEQDAAVGYGEMALITSRRWKALSEEEMKPLKEKAAVDFRRYKEAVDTFHRNQRSAPVPCKVC